MEVGRALQRGENLISTSLWRDKTHKFYLNAVIEMQKRVLVATSNPKSMLNILKAAEDMGKGEEVALIDSGKPAKVLVCSLFIAINTEIQALTEVLVVDISKSALSKSLITSLQAIIQSFLTIPKAIFTSSTNKTRLNLLSESFPCAISLLNTISMTLERTKHYKIECERQKWKSETLFDLLGALNYSNSVVYFEKRREMQSVAYFLAGEGLEIASVHAKMPYEVGERVINNFEAGRIRTLLLCEPIHMSSSLTTVHYNLPTAQQYLTRVGRRRLGGLGLSIVLLTAEEQSQLIGVERTICVKFPDLPMDVNDWL